MAKHVLSWRWPTLAMFVAAEAVVILAIVITFTPPASAQFFEGGFPLWQRQWNRNRRYKRKRTYRSFRNRQRNYYTNDRSRNQRPNVDYSRAPAAKKKEGTPETTVMVFGDSMADWLAYGLELSFTESPEMGVVRKHRTLSGLVRRKVRRKHQKRYPDWPSLARKTLASEKPDFIVMMIGVNDRRPIRYQSQPARPAAAQPDQPQQGGTAEGRSDQRKPQSQSAERKPARKPKRAVTRKSEFRTDKWVELYIERIDKTIAALKSAKVPVFWVGLPPVRGKRSTADMSFLNDLIRSRADRGGIVYVDVWDGFVDESGRFARYGPDVQGQNRRLRTSDGVHFTKAGAQKLAHFLERELQRSMTVQPTPVVLSDEEAAGSEAQNAGTAAGVSRPLAGPVIPLAGRRANENHKALVGGERRSRGRVDAVAQKVLLRGAAVPAPAGRADDFSWPRREIAPVGADPVVSVARLPMTPMKGKPRAAPPPAVAEGPAAIQPGAIRPRVATRPRAQRRRGGLFSNWGWQQPQRQYRRQQQRRRTQPGFFPFLFRR